MTDNRGANSRMGSPAANHQRANIALHIEHLVIEGLPLSAGHERQLQRAMRSELMRLLQRDGLGSNLQTGSVPVLAAPAIRVVSSSRPGELGRQIAHSVHQSLTRLS